jgi:hypothetical protein
LKPFIFIMMITLFALERPLSAVTVEIKNPCGGASWLITNHKLDHPQSVGALTLEVFEQSQITYLGSVEGINSINKTPMGSDALEVISDRNMRAYGWCYAIDSEVSEGLAHEQMIKHDQSHLVWFFGFANYIDGNWVTMCEPTAESRPKFICGEPA